MVCLGRPYPFKSFKGCLPQNLLSPLSNTLSHMTVFQDKIDLRVAPEMKWNKNSYLVAVKHYR